MEKVTNYLKNVGKSMKFATVDVLKDTAPTITEIIDDNNDLFKEIANVVRQRKTVKNRMNTAFENNKVYDAANQIKKSIFEDLSSGNFYNAARTQAATDSAADAFMAGIDDFDIIMNEDDMFGDDDVSDFSAGDTHIANTIRQNGEASARAISTSIVKSSEYVVKSQQEMFELQYATTFKELSNISSNVMAINENIAKVLDFKNNVQRVHMENSKTYYEESLNIFRENNAILKEMIEMKRNLYNKEYKTPENSTNKNFSDIFSGGSIDIKEYANYLKNKVSYQAESASGGVLDFISPDKMVEILAGSPLAGVAKAAASIVMGTTLKDSIVKFDRSMSGFFGALMSRFNTMARDSWGTLPGKIGEFLGIDTSLDIQIKTGKYEKGPVPWDGVARKSLVEVIPTYLAKQLSVMTGMSEKIYNFETGMFEDAKMVERDYDNFIDSAVEGSTREVRKRMDNVIEKEFSFADPKKQESLNKDMDKFFRYFFDRGEIFDHTKKTYDDYSDMGVNKDNFNIISEIFKAIPRHSQLEMYGNIMSGRSDLDKSIRTLEVEGDSVYKNIANRSNINEYVNENGKGLKDGIGAFGGSDLFKSKDEFDKNIFFYLRTMSRTLLEGIKVYTMNGSVGGTKKKGGANTVNRDIDSILGRNISLGETSAIDDAINHHKRHKQEAEKKNAEELDPDAQYLDFMSPEEIREALKKKKAIKNASGESGKNEGFFADLVGKSLSEKFEIMSGKLKKTVKSPGGFLSGLVDRIDLRLYEVIYGRDDQYYKGEKVKGFLDILMVDLKKTFANFNTWMDEKLFKPLSNKFGDKNPIDKLLGMFGIETTTKDLKKKAGKFLFGEKDEFGSYKSRGLFSGFVQSVADNAFSIKNATIGKNVTFRKMYAILRQYSKDPSKWNTIDRIDVLEKMIETMKGFSSIFRKELVLADKIKKLLKKTTAQNVEKNLMELITLFQASDYGEDDEAIISKLKEAFSTAKGYMMGEDVSNIDKIYDIYGIKDEVNEKSVHLDPRKANPGKFKAIILVLSKYILDTSSIRDEVIYEVGGLIKNIETSNDEESTIKAHIESIYVKGAISENDMGFDKAAVDILKYLHSKLPKQPYTVNIPGYIAKSNFSKRVIKKNDGVTPPKKVIRGTKGIKAADYINKQSGKDDDPDIDGSHEDGLAHVPKDGYIAELHQGERVLTKEENSRFSELLKLTEDKKLAMLDRIQNLISTDTSTDKSKIDKKTKIKSLMDKFTGNNVDEVLMEVLEETENNKTVKDPNAKKPLINLIMNEFSGMMNTTQRLLFGENAKEDKDGNAMKKQLSDTFTDSLSKIKEFAPHIGSGALLGGGLGLVPGLLGGPLLWATIGAGVSLNKHSSKFNEFLFGSNDEEGNEIKPGVIPKSIINAMEKYAPDMKKFGTIGAATAILPFTPFGLAGGLFLGGAAAFAKNNSKAQEFLFGEDGLIGEGGKKKIEEILPKLIPGAGLGSLVGLAALGPVGIVGGAMIGSAASYASTTDKFKEKIFGSEDKDGLLGKNGLEKVKEFLPRALVGTLAAGTLGPFGLMGSMVLGSTLSMVSVTDHFKDEIFGKADKDGKRSGGFLTHAKTSVNTFLEDNIKAPFKSAVEPFSNEIKLMSKSFSDSVKTSVDNVFRDSFGAPLKELVDEKIVKPFTGLFKKVFSTLGKMVGGVISSPFKAMGSIAKDLRLKHEKDGTFSYDEDTKEEKGSPEQFLKSVQSKIEEVKEGGIGKRKASSPKLAGHSKVGDRTKDLMGRVRKFGEDLQDASNKGIVSPHKMYTQEELDKAKSESEDKSNKKPSFRDRVKQALNNERGSLSFNRDKKVKTEEPSTEANVDTDDQSGKSDKKKKRLNIKEVIDQSISRFHEKTEKEKKKSNKSSEEEAPSNTDLKDINRNTLNIYNEVNGQLDGVGYNVETIKNILVDNFGQPSEEATGSRTGRGNRKRRGFFGKIMDFVSNPFRSLKDKGKSLLFGKDGKGGIFGWVFKGMDKIKQIITLPFKLVKEAYGIVKGMGSALLQGIKMIGPMVGEALKGVGYILKGAGSFVGSTLKGIGIGIGKAAVPLLEGVGHIGKEFLKLGALLPKTIGLLADFGISLGKTIFAITKTVLGGAAKAVKGIASFTTSKLFGKKDPHKMNLTIKGGHLDSVGSIDKPVGLLQESIDKLLKGSDIEAPKTPRLQPVESDVEVKAKEDRKSLHQGIKDSIKEGFMTVKETLSNSRGSLRPTENETIMPTEFGTVRYKVNREGSKVPIKDKIFKKVKAEEDRDNNVNDSIKEAMIKNAENTTKMSEALAGNDEEGKGKGIFGGITGMLGMLKPALLLLLPLMPKIIGFIKDGMPVLEKFGGQVNDKINDTVGSDSNPLENKKRVALNYAVHGNKTKLLRKATDFAVKKAAGNSTVAKVATNALGTVVKGIQKFFSSPKIVAAISKIMPEAGPKICSTLSSKLGGAIGKKAGPSVLGQIAKKMAQNATVVIAAAMAAVDIASGFADAESILMTSGDLPIKFKLATGIAKALNNRITFGLVPLKWIIQTIISIIGSDEESAELKAGQDQLKQEYQKYVEAQKKKGTDEKNILSLDQYNKEENGSFVSRNASKASRKVKGWFGKDDKKDDKKAGKGYGKGYPEFNQNDDRWKDKNYNSGKGSQHSIGKSGCGPTSAAMLASGLTGKSITPDKAAKDAKNYKDEDGGTRPEFFKSFFSKNGLGSNTKIVDTTTGKGLKDSFMELNKKNPLVLMGKYTNPLNGVKGGMHYILGKDIDENGNISINDPEVGSYKTKAETILSATNLAINPYEHDNRMKMYKSLGKKAINGIQGFGKGHEDFTKTKDKEYGKGTPKIQNVKKKKSTPSGINSGSKLLELFITLLTRIADNTDKLSQIVALLSEKANIPKEELDKIKNGKGGISILNVAKGAENVENTDLLHLISTLEEIASQ